MEFIQWLSTNAVLGTPGCPKAAHEGAHAWSQNYDITLLQQTLRHAVQELRHGIELADRHSQDPSWEAARPNLQKHHEVMAMAYSVQTAIQTYVDPPKRHIMPSSLSSNKGVLEGVLPHVGCKRPRAEEEPLVEQETIADRVERQQNAFRAVGNRLNWNTTQELEGVDAILEAGPLVTEDCLDFPTSLMSSDFLVDIVYSAEDGFVSDVRLQHSYEGAPEIITRESTADQSRLLLNILRQTSRDQFQHTKSAADTNERALRRAISEFEAKLQLISNTRHTLLQLPTPLQAGYHEAYARVAALEPTLRSSLQVLRAWSPGLYVRQHRHAPMLLLTADPAMDFWARVPNIKAAVASNTIPTTMGLAVHVPHGLLFSNAAVHHLSSLLEAPEVDIGSLDLSSYTLQPSGPSSLPCPSTAADFVHVLLTSGPTHPQKDGRLPVWEDRATPLLGYHPYHRNLTIKYAPTKQADGSFAAASSPLPCMVVKRIPVVTASQVRAIALFCAAQSLMNDLLRSCFSHCQKATGSPGLTPNLQLSVSLTSCFVLHLVLDEDLKGSTRHLLSLAIAATQVGVKVDIMFVTPEDARLPMASLQEATKSMEGLLEDYQNVPHAMTCVLDLLAVASCRVRA